MKAIVGVEIECFGRYCLNDCYWMQWNGAGSTIHTCLLFDDGKPLKWDHRKRENGHIRKTACKQAEGK